MEAIDFDDAARNGIFYFKDDNFFVDTGGHSHRRATIAELRSHFDRRADRPAHWYEAQLIHYGLPASRVKGTAKMRLQYAVREDDIRLPGSMKRMEEDLRRKWEARRMADDLRRDWMVVEVQRKRPFGVDDLVIQGPFTKKRINTERALPGTTARRTPSNTAPGERTLPPAVQDHEPRVKVEPRHGWGPDPAWGGKQEYDEDEDEDWDMTTLTNASVSPPNPSPRTTCHGALSARDVGRHPRKRAERPGLPALLSAYGLDPGPDPFGAGRRGYSALGPAIDEGPDSFDDFIFPPEDDSVVADRVDFGPPIAPTPYSGHNTVGAGTPQTPPPPRQPPRLGLINGRYEISFAHNNGPKPSLVLEDRHDIPSTYNTGPKHSLVLTLDGTMIWGFLEMQYLTGVLKIARRPYNASGEKLDLVWRGVYDDDGYQRFHDGTRGGSGQHLSFHGGGEVRCLVKMGGGAFYDFTALRVSGEETRSEISAREMRQRWDDIGT
ncbi:hypothetical protein IMZ48_19315 [Candidatus Bathyarchaeota archaeon]|nr:hypothetical protein [Candidatus Bathyarchaeota archaeon]